MKIVNLLLYSLLLSTHIYGEVIHVPADNRTIQLAINAAKPGDTILVAEGIYYEQINFLGKKPLVVCSEFLIDQDPGHISSTIIDGSRLQDPDVASVVNFISGEDTTSIICGFTIQHGSGTYTPNYLNNIQGGGIWISEAGAKIIHNRITHNTLDDSQAVNGTGTSGAGIGSNWEDSGNWLVIENNSIDSNTCISRFAYAFGGGIATSSNTRISNNIISNNTCSGIDYGTAHGGGIGCGKDPSWTNKVYITIEHNTIANNKSCSQNNLANSAAVFISDLPVIFESNEVVNNKVVTAAKSGGVSGLYLFQPGEGSLVSKNIFRGNSSNRWGGALGMQNNTYLNNQVFVEKNYFFENIAQNGGALLSFNVPAKIQNNVFSGNKADKGGAVFFWKSETLPVVHLAVLINNSFSGNTAAFMGGALHSLNSKPLIINSLFYSNQAVEGQEIWADTIEIAFSTIDPTLIFGVVVDGGGNISACPILSDPVLLTLSPYNNCENHGTLTYTCQCGENYFCPNQDITGVTRPQGLIVEYGAYEYENKCLPVEEFEYILQCYPNPFTTSITIEYTLKISGQVILQIYNCVGQLIAEPINESQLYGTKKVEWNAASLPPGIYHCRFLAGEFHSIKKIIKI